MADRTTHKVCLFVDNNSLAKVLDGRKANFKLLRNWLAGDREAVLSIFYCGEINRAPHESREKLYKSLKGAGFDVKITQNPISRAPNPESDSDIGSAIACQITWDMAEAINQGYYDSLVILSGAHEIADVVRRIRRKGIEVEVVYDQDKCPPTLRGASNRFRQLLIEKVTFSEVPDEVLA